MISSQRPSLRADHGVAGPYFRVSIPSAVAAAPQYAEHVPAPSPRAPAAPQSPPQFTVSAPRPTHRLRTLQHRAPSTPSWEFKGGSRDANNLSQTSRTRFDHPGTPGYLFQAFQSTIIVSSVPSQISVRKRPQTMTSIYKFHPRGVSP